MSEYSMKSLKAGYSAVIIGASGGIGGAISAALKSDPNCFAAVPLSRSSHGFDITDEASMQRAAGALELGAYDLVICATGALTIDGVGPERSIRQISQTAMLAQFTLNAVGPALVLKHFAPLLARKGRTIFAFLSARVGSITDNALGGWISYRSSKAALNQIVRTGAIEIGRINPQSVVVSIHPGSVKTTLSDPFASGHERMEPADAAQGILGVLDGLQPSQTGRFFAYDGSAIPW
ncbi:SDR family NAD(P)-dependent oxidoreductase [Ensifer sp. PDNC004]|uniref:SDR family NAD(P)-dependent oxidoreductase n=1 Tax=Ensifer sp. PDNC004 TaxID=2811423 RepID=UPI001FEF1593|nr:SDR family NAD(P)-dependent oxidoreductase [Ensifer sp. PDNC004]